jgi:hypothetical protein
MSTDLDLFSLALVIQYTCALLSFVACPALQYFSTLSHKRHDFRKRKLLNLKCVFSFSLRSLSETFLMLRRTERDMTINVYWCSCKVPVVFVRVSWNLKFLDRFSNNVQISNFIKIRPVGAELFHADRRTDMPKLTVAFLNFANAPKNQTHLGWLVT